MAAAALVHRRAFEGLFELELKPGPALADALRQAGYDLGDPQEKYTLEVWQRCVDAGRQHLYPDLPQAQGDRRMGQHFVRGFARTLVGQVYAAATPMLGPDRVLARFPRFLMTVRDDLLLGMDWLGPQRWRVRVSDPKVPSPEFHAGVMEQVLLLAGCIPDVSVEARDGTYALLVSWRLQTPPP
jgi:uncharacterized protein (TIGR02265 family)